jgi:hypothetical protein
MKHPRQRRVLRREAAGDFTRAVRGSVIDNQQFAGPGKSTAATRRNNSGRNSSSLYTGMIMLTRGRIIADLIL